MNELMIVLKSGGGWLYFKTKETSADRAFTKWLETCEESGMNIDNLSFSFAELRDNDGEAIDSKRF